MIRGPSPCRASIAVKYSEFSFLARGVEGAGAFNWAGSHLGEIKPNKSEALNGSTGTSQGPLYLPLQMETELKRHKLFRSLVERREN